jgi:hypothetical protein
VASETTRSPEQVREQYEIENVELFELFRGCGFGRVTIYSSLRGSVKPSR